MGSGWKHRLCAPVPAASHLCGFSRMRAARPGACHVLAYHGIGMRDIPVDAFSRHLEYLSRHFRVVSLARALERIGQPRFDRRKGSLPEVALTFDDGLRNFLTHALPLLTAYRFPATLFVCPALAESGRWQWNHELREREKSRGRDRGLEARIETLKDRPEADRISALDEARRRTPAFEPDPEQREAFDVLGFDELRSLDEELVTIGAHGLEHEVLTGVAPDEGERRVRRCRNLLEDRLGRTVEYFSYPNGRLSAASVTAVSRHFAAAVSARPGLVDSDTDPHLVPRILAHPELSRLTWRMQRSASPRPRGGLPPASAERRSTRIPRASSGRAGGSGGIRIEPLGAEHLPALGRFSVVTWDRPRRESFLRWRFLEGSQEGVSETFLAMEGAECVGVLSAFPREYLIGNLRCTVLEIFDWFCRPDRIGEGIGGRLLRAMTTRPVPVLAFGGTKMTLDRLPHLGWKEITEARCYEHPCSGERLGAILERRTGVPRELTRGPLGVLRTLLAPRIPCPSAEVNAVPATRPRISCTGEATDRSTGLPMRQTHSPVFWEWVQRDPAAGRFLSVAFGDPPCARAVLRLYASSKGRTGAIIELDAERDPELLAGMVVGCARVLSRLGADRVVSAATLPAVQAAFDRNRWIRRGSFPIHAFGLERVLPAGLDRPVVPDIMLNGGDDAFVPYCTGGFPVRSR